MIWRSIPLTLFLFFSPGLLRAQSPGNSPPLIAFAEGPANSDKMYEDIEIFRRILDRKLHSLYLRKNDNVGVDYGLRQSGMMSMPPGMMGGIMGTPGVMGGMMGMPVGMNRQIPLMTTYQTTFPILEGVYLKGQGVVYTATLSSLQLTAKDETAIKPLSEWESVRRQLHNEKEDPKKPEATKLPTLSAVLLKVLAENGHHFSQLGENESLTLVLTVRESKPPAPARNTAASYGAAITAAKPYWAEVKETPSASSKVRDLELLGDLHMKQSHYGMARDAFREAMEMKPGPEQTAALACKLAQAYLMLGNIEEARGALDQAVALKKEAADAKNKPAPASKSVALPVKLMISAPKKLLVEAKAGKLSFEEFRAKAHVETLRFDNRR